MKSQKCTPYVYFVITPLSIPQKVGRKKVHANVALVAFLKKEEVPNSLGHIALQRRSDNKEK